MPTPEVIRLSINEWNYAGKFGSLRRAEHDAKRAGTGEVPSCTAADDFYAAITEFAAAKFFGGDVMADWLATKAYVPNGGRHDLPDVGRNAYVRKTVFGKKLLLVYEDPDAEPVQPWPAGVKRKYDVARAPFILALHDDPAGTNPVRTVVHLAGWAWSDEVRRTGKWMATFRTPCWGLSKDLLEPMSTFPMEYIR